MTIDEKEKMGVLLMQYHNDVRTWFDAEEDFEKKAHYKEILDSIDILLDSFKEGLHVEEW